MLSVDAPTKRASPELALMQPLAAGTYELTLRAAEPVAPARQAELTLHRLGSAVSQSKVSGLKGITRAAGVEGKDTAKSAGRSINELHAAVAHLRAAGAVEYEGEALLRIAATYFWRIDDSPKAAAAANDAMALFARIGNRVMRSQAASLRGASLIEIANAMRQPGRRGGVAPEQSQFDEAMRLLAEAAQEFKAAAMPYDQAQAINYQGVGYFHQAQYGHAKEKYLQAARMFEALGEKTRAALPLQNIAHIDIDSGDYDKAIDSNKSILALLSPADNASQYVTVLINLGSAQYGIGKFDDALRSFVSALGICQERNLAAEGARSLHSLGMVYLVIGERARAEVYLKRALALRRTLASQNPRGLQTSLIRVGDLRRERGDLRGALNLHVEALDWSLSPSQKARAFYAIGRDQEALEALPAATQAYHSALQLGLSEDSPLYALIQGSHARVRVKSGDKSARAVMLNAAQLHERHGDLDFAAQDHLALAMADKSSGNPGSALEEVRKALSLYESQRLGATNPDLRATYLASRGAALELEGDLYMTLWERASNPTEKRRLSDLALLANDANRRRVLEDFRSLASSASTMSSAGRAALDAQLSAKRHRLAVLMEQQNPPVDRVDDLRRDIGLLRTQLDVARARSTDAPLAEGAQAVPKTAREIQRALAPDEMLLAYQLGDQRSWLWSITRESTSATQLQGRAEIEAAAQALYAAWSTPGGLSLDPIRELAASRTILGPAVDSLHRKQTLTIVSEGVLRRLPFGALLLPDRSGKAGRRIAATHAVRVRSTISGDAESMGGDADPPRPANRILLVGDPTVPDAARHAPTDSAADPWAWQPLPGTRKEVHTIAEIADDWRSYILLGAEATKPALLDLPLDSFRAIHFATHARLDTEDPQLSSIALSSREASFASPSSLLTVREILGFRLNAETVVLSACEASLGKDYRGQFSFGLSEAFLLAGAKNVLGSVWRVSDEATQVYMRRFYDAYVRRDASPTASAQSAARSMLDNPEYAHPYFWAAFVVTQR